MIPASRTSTASQLSDVELARQVGTGDPAAFTVMMRRHNQSLYRAARSILKDDAEAEDAVQEAYLLAYRAMPGFRGEAKLSSWLVKIVVNESIARARKRTRRAEVIGGTSVPFAASSSRCAATSTAATCLQSLPTGQEHMPLIPRAPWRPRPTVMRCR